MDRHRLCYAVSQSNLESRFLVQFCVINCCAHDKKFKKLVSQCNWHLCESLWGPEHTSKAISMRGHTTKLTACVCVIMYIYLQYVILYETDWQIGGRELCRSVDLWQYLNLCKTQVSSRVASRRVSRFACKFQACFAIYGMRICMRMRGSMLCRGVLLLLLLFSNRNTLHSWMAEWLSSCKQANSDQYKRKLHRPRDTASIFEFWLMKSAKRLSRISAKSKADFTSSLAWLGLAGSTSERKTRRRRRGVSGKYRCREQRSA